MDNFKKLLKIFEMEINDVELSDTQKKVLVKIKTAVTPKTAYEDVSDDENEITARDTLQKMNIIDIVNSEVTITDQGIEVMKDEGLTDESGELFPKIIDKYISKEERDGIENPPGEENEPLGGEDLFGDDSQIPPPKSMESYSLMKSPKRRLISEIFSGDFIKFEQWKEKVLDKFSDDVYFVQTDDGIMAKAKGSNRLLDYIAACGKKSGFKLSQEDLDRATKIDFMR